ncbi:MAG: hypothetical protein KL863_11015 [Rhizobium sp.]|nr:hypothetical protein [Rhizobium sp.]
MRTGDLDTLVLATVNAPYSLKLDAGDVVACLNDPAEMKSASGPMSSFFYDVTFELQRDFALAHGVSFQTLAEAAALFGTWSGIRWAGDRAA